MKSRQDTQFQSNAVSKQSNFEDKNRSKADQQLTREPQQIDEREKEYQPGQKDYLLHRAVSPPTYNSYQRFEGGADQLRFSDIPHGYPPQQGSFFDQPVRHDNFPFPADHPYHANWGPQQCNCNRDFYIQRDPAFYMQQPPYTSHGPTVRGGSIGSVGGFQGFQSRIVDVPPPQQFGPSSQFPQQDYIQLNPTTRYYPLQHHQQVQQNYYSKYLPPQNQRSISQGRPVSIQEQQSKYLNLQQQQQLDQLGSPKPQRDLVNREYVGQQDQTSQQADRQKIQENRMPAWQQSSSQITQQAAREYYQRREQQQPFYQQDSFQSTQRPPQMQFEPPFNYYDNRSVPSAQMKPRPMGQFYPQMPQQQGQPQIPDFNSETYIPPPSFQMRQSMNPQQRRFNNSCSVQNINQFQLRRPMKYGVDSQLQSQFEKEQRRNEPNYYYQPSIQQEVGGYQQMQYMQGPPFLDQEGHAPLERRMWEYGGGFNRDPRERYVQQNIQEERQLIQSRGYDRADQQLSDGFNLSDIKGPIKYFNQPQKQDLNQMSAYANF